VESEKPAALNPSHPDVRLRDLRMQLDIPFLSLTAAFRERAPSRSCSLESEQLFFHGKGHLNAKCSQLAAVEMCEWLVQTRAAAAASPETRRQL
jgi:hypothetical protein